MLLREKKTLRVRLAYMLGIRKFTNKDTEKLEKITNLLKEISWLLFSLTELTRTRNKQPMFINPNNVVRPS